MKKCNHQQLNSALHLKLPTNLWLNIEQAKKINQTWAKLRLCRQIIKHTECMQKLWEMEAYPVYETTKPKRCDDGSWESCGLSEESPQNQNHHKSLLLLLSLIMSTNLLWVCAPKLREKSSLKRVMMVNENGVLWKFGRLQNWSVFFPTGERGQE